MQRTALASGHRVVRIWQHSYSAEWMLCGFGFRELNIAPQLLRMLPYLTTLFALMFTGKKLRAPAADGVPFVHPISTKRAEKNSKTTHTKKRSA